MRALAIDSSRSSMVSWAERSAASSPRISAERSTGDADGDTTRSGAGGWSLCSGGFGGEGEEENGSPVGMTLGSIRIGSVVAAGGSDRFGGEVLGSEEVELSEDELAMLAECWEDALLEA